MLRAILLLLPWYLLVIVYDPDIRLDGNPKNDECTSANNKKERSGADQRQRAQKATDSTEGT